MKKAIVLILAALLMMSSIVFADPAPTIISTACTSDADCASDQVCSPCPEESACTSEKICMGSETEVRVVPDTTFPEGATRVMLCGNYEHDESGTFTRLHVYAPPFPNTNVLTLENRDIYDIEARRVNVAGKSVKLQISKRTGATGTFGHYELSLAKGDVATTGPAGQEIKVRLNNVLLSQYSSHRSPGWWWLMRGGCVELDIGPKSEAPVARTATAVQARPTATLTNSLQAALPSVSMGAALPPKTKFQAKQPELKPMERVTDADVSGAKFRFSEYTCQDGTLNFDAGNGCAPLGEWYAKAKRFCKEHRNIQDFKVFNASACVPGGLGRGGATTEPRAEGALGTEQPVAGAKAPATIAVNPIAKRSWAARLLGKWWSVP